MEKILKEFYHIDIDYIQNGYFEYNHCYYFIGKVDDMFFKVYSYYDYMIHLLGLKGYKIVRNVMNQIVSKGYVVMVYEYEVFDIERYLMFSLKTLPEYTLTISDIKDRWIQKIDLVRNEICKYSYSFQYNKDLNALMHYYCGLGENAVMILNEILAIEKQAKISASLSLKSTISSYYELLNPYHYTISSKSKHILNLLKSDIIDIDVVLSMIKQSYFDIFELYYLYARAFYNSDFFEYVLNGKITEEYNDYFLKGYKKEIIIIKKIRNIITNFISLPEISWIDDENML